MPNTKNTHRYHPNTQLRYTSNTHTHTHTHTHTNDTVSE